jgi:hypothetical protein
LEQELEREQELELEQEREQELELEQERELELEQEREREQEQEQELEREQELELEQERELEREQEREQEQEQEQEQDMIEKPDREKMREKAETALRGEWRHVVHGFDDLVEFTPMKDYSGELTPANAAHIVAFQPQAALQLLDQIDELEARLTTEREAGFRGAIDLLRSYEATCSTIPFPAMHAQWLENKLKENHKPGQTVCAHGNPEPMLCKECRK